MNNQMRKALRPVCDLADRLADQFQELASAVQDGPAEPTEELLAKIQDLAKQVPGIESETESAADEEQEKLDNLNEGQLAGPVGLRLEETAEALQNAHDYAQSAKCYADELSELIAVPGEPIDGEDLSNTLDALSDCLEQCHDALSEAIK